MLLVDVWQDVRQSARGLRQNPGFALAAILMLALGIGGTTAIFSVVNGVLINPLPYPDSHALVRIVHAIGGEEQPYFNDAIYVTYAEHTQAFQDLGVWMPGTTATITGAGDPEEVRTLTASRSVLTTLGVVPEIGRWFTEAEDRPGAAATVLLTYEYWQRAYGGDRAVLNRAMTINARSHQIVGVMPSGFRFSQEFDLIVPLQVDRGQLIAGFRLLGVARVKPGVPLPQANADAARVLHVWFENFKVNPQVRPRWSPSLRPLKQDVVGDIGPLLWVLMSAVAVVLLMACGNVANLLLVRAEARRREFAIRGALGAPGGRVARLLFSESLLLALAAGLFGVALASGGLRLLIAMGPPDLPRLSEIAIDARALAFAVAASVLSGLLFGSLAVLRHYRPRLEDVANAGRIAGTTRERQRVHQLLVGAQVALALMLLVGAGLMIRSFQELRRVDPGFGDPGGVQTFGVSIPPSLVAEAERVTRTQQEMLDHLASIPGVVSTAFATRMPMGSDRSSAAFAVEGRADDGGTPPNHQVKVVSPGLFETLDIRLIAGRDFTWTDVYGTRDLAIVSENLSRSLWGSPEAAIGQRIREYYVKGSPWQEIVGVVANVHDDGADLEPPMTVYWPAQPRESLLDISGYGARRVSVALRTDRAGSAGLLAEIRRAVRAVNPMLPLAQVRTLDELYRQSTARTSFTLMMLAIAGGTAVVLGVSGLYGVIAYAVSQRRREIGIRLALGAQAREVRTLFVRRGLRVLVGGLAIGLAGALAVTRLMDSLLFGVSPLDPAAFIVMTALLGAAAGLASYLPARRATSVDPVETLRAE